MSEQLAIKIVSEAEAEGADLVVCALADAPRHFDDDVETTCHDCRRPIIHRPHAPKTPIKVCAACALSRIDGGPA